MRQHCNPPILMTMAAQAGKRTVMEGRAPPPISISRARRVELTHPCRLHPLAVCTEDSLDVCRTTGAGPVEAVYQHVPGALAGGCRRLAAAQRRRRGGCIGGVALSCSFKAKSGGSSGTAHHRWRSECTLVSQSSGGWFCSLLPASLRRR